jgi:hypothetical protein
MGSASVALARLADSSACRAEQLPASVLFLLRQGSGMALSLPHNVTGNCLNRVIIYG